MARSTRLIADAESQNTLDSQRIRGTPAQPFLATASFATRLREAGDHRRAFQIRWFLDVSHAPRVSETVARSTVAVRSASGRGRSLKWHPEHRIDLLRLTSTVRANPEEKAARSIDTPPSLIGDDCEDATVVSVVPAGCLPYGRLYDKAKQLLVQAANRPALLEHTEE